MRNLLHYASIVIFIVVLVTVQAKQVIDVVKEAVDFSTRVKDVTKTAGLPVKCEKSSWWSLGSSAATSCALSNKQLLGVQSGLKTLLPCQPHAVKQLSRALQEVGQTKRQSAFMMLLFGEGGTGKSVSARLLAELAYGKGKCFQKCALILSTQSAAAKDSIGVGDGRAVGQWTYQIRKHVQNAGGSALVVLNDVHKFPYAMLHQIADLGKELPGAVFVLTSNKLEEGKTVGVKDIVPELKLRKDGLTYDVSLQSRKQLARRVRNSILEASRSEKMTIWTAKNNKKRVPVESKLRAKQLEAYNILLESISDSQIIPFFPITLRCYRHIESEIIHSIEERVSQACNLHLVNLKSLAKSPSTSTLYASNKAHESTQNGLTEIEGPWTTYAALILEDECIETAAKVKSHVVRSIRTAATNDEL